MENIIFLHNHFLKPGGASKVVLEQASKLSDKGLKCIIITSRANPDVIKPYKNIRIVELSKLTSGNLLFWFTFPLFFLKLQSTIKHFSPKIIYCHSLAIYWGYFYKKFNNHSKLVYYLHDLGLPYTDHKFEIEGLQQPEKIILKILSPLLKMLNKNIISTADYIIANSQTSADYLKRVYHRKSDRIIWPAVDTTIFKKSKIKKDYIFTVGRLEKLKRIDNIIKGFAEYYYKYSDSKTKLLIVGTGVEAKNLIKLVKKYKIQNQVKFLGQVSSKEVAKIVSQGKLGIFLCPYETFGIAAAESLSCGTPIIGIDTGGIREIMSKGNMGESVNGSEESISVSISKLLKHPKILREMSENAVSFSKGSLALDIQITKLYKFIKSISSTT